jgi:preprotein translocase subunit SecA
VETAGRRITLAIVDEIWADYLANVAELRGGVIWTSWGSGDPLLKFLTGEREIYDDFEESVKDGVAEAFENAIVSQGAVTFENTGRLERGATWTYVTTDQPFGTYTERVMKGFRKKFTK